MKSDRENMITLDNFCNLWLSKKGTLYVLDYDDYDEIDDAIQLKGKIEIKDILDETGTIPYFSIWVDEIMYRLCGFVQDAYCKANVYAFITIPSGIIAFIDYKDVRKYEEQYKEQENELV